jgi:hypothetical protein
MTKNEHINYRFLFTVRDIYFDGGGSRHIIKHVIFLYFQKHANIPVDNGPSSNTLGNKTGLDGLSI